MTQQATASAGPAPTAITRTTRTLQHPELPAIRVYFEYVTPRRATEYLARNTRNRSKRPRHIAALADAMRRGEFVFNGDTVRLAEDGILHDAQHRLEGIVETGCAQWMLVVDGLPLDAAKTIDIGRKRTAGDIFALLGHSRSLAEGKHLAAMCRNVWLYEHYGTFINPTGKQADADPQQLEDVLYRHMGLTEIKRPASGSLLRVSWRSALEYLCSLADREMAEWFFARLADGAGISPGEPVYALRDRMLKVAVRGSMIKMQPERQVALTIRAWNATLAGQRLSKLQVPDAPLTMRIAGCPVVPQIDVERS